MVIMVEVVVLVDILVKVDLVDFMVQVREQMDKVEAVAVDLDGRIVGNKVLVVEE